MEPGVRGAHSSHCAGIPATAPRAGLQPVLHQHRVEGKSGGRFTAVPAPAPARAWVWARHGPAGSTTCLSCICPVLWDILSYDARGEFARWAKAGLPALHSLTSDFHQPQ